MNEVELKNQIRQSNEMGKNLDFTMRDAQTKNIHFACKKIIKYIDTKSTIIQHPNSYLNLIKFFFGEIGLNKKKHYLIEIGFPEEIVDDIFSKLDLKSVNEKYELGITKTIPLSLKKQDGEGDKLAREFITLLTKNALFEDIKRFLIKFDNVQTSKFTSNVISNLLFAYDPIKYCVINNPVINGLKSKFGIDIKVNSFQDYFDNIWILDTIKNEFGCSDFGQVDSILTGFSVSEIIESCNELLVKNQILYGPPGTGKTFITKKLALRILGEIND